MKKRKLSSVLLICVVTALLAGMVSIITLAGGNDPAVVYDHYESKFLFRNMERTDYRADDAGATGDFGDGLRAYPDLFRNFKNVMPGDRIEQTFVVETQNLTGGVVEIILRADPYNDKNADRHNYDISEQELETFWTLMDSGMVELTVSWENESRSYHYTCRQLLSEGVSLGKFYKDDRREVTATLTMSTEAGNEFADLQAGIGWVFTAWYFDDGSGGLPPGSGGLPPGSGSGIVWPGWGGEGDGVEHHAYIIGKPDGLIHPEAPMTRAEVATVFFRLMGDEMRGTYWSNMNPYSDVLTTDWFNNAVSTLTNAGVLIGRPGKAFDPDGNITRAEFVTMAVRLFGIEGVKLEDTDRFSDIADHWANTEINAAYELGLVKGMPDGTFQPDREITRAEVMTVVNRMLGRIPDKDHLHEDMITWPDNMDTSAWYYADVQEATNSHIHTTKTDEDDQSHEVWEELTDVRDWAALERQWVEYNASQSLSEEVSSRESYQFD